MSEKKLGAALRQAILGTWNLSDWYIESEDGTKTYPLGPGATGYISYSNDDHVFVHITAKGRDKYAIEDPFGGSLEEDAAAAKSHISYAGPFSVNEDRISHHVTHASFPNWVGSEQIRTARLDGDTLTLVAEGATFNGMSATAYVVWKRGS